MLVKILLRGGIPLVIMSVLSIIMKMQGISSFQVKSTFVTGLIIASVAGASVIYEVDKWSLLTQSLLHFLVMFMTVYPCLLVSGWFQLDNIGDYLKVFGIFVGVGIVLWGIMYILFTKIMK